MKEILLWTLTICSLAGVIYLLFDKFSSPSGNHEKGEIAYVDVSKVYQSFDMQNELKSKLQAEVAFKQSTVDSLLFQLQALNSQLEIKGKPTDQEIEEFQNLQQFYIQQKQLVDDFVTSQTNIYDAQILEQLSQYIKDYGKTKMYAYVLGATGNGNILYGDEMKDITEEVIDFVNNKYQGYN